ncbi:MAG: SprB repeat-containing protein, partial [Flavobacteriales bacterium]
GGTGNKTYAWSNGSSTSSLSNAPAGSYSVTVTDANGCSANQSFSITQPSAITVNITTTAITCSSSNNGTLTASATGGTGNKTYSWNTGATGSILSNLAAGSYTVTATDANACTTTQTTTLVAPTALAISGSETDILCAGDANGSINVGVSGGTGNVALAWSNGSTGASLVNLGPGSYTVTATDANNCSAQMSYTINAPAPLNVTVQDFDIACNDFVGSAQAVVSGGVAPHTLSWSNGATGTNVSNLNEGNYSVSVMDAHGCASATTAFTISSTPHLSVFIQATDVTCAGLNDGTATVVVNGGDQNYTYSWNQGAASSNLQNLGAGEYSVSVMDGAGCMGSATLQIAEPTPLVVSETVTHVTCFGNNSGSIELDINGGRAPYTKLWNTGSTEDALNNIA